MALKNRTDPKAFARDMENGQVTPVPAQTSELGLLDLDSCPASRQKGLAHTSDADRSEYGKPDLVFVALLLPIIPAVVIYKLLPASTHVSGPFKGLQIKLGGAAAFYFLLLLTVYFWPRPSPAYKSLDVERVYSGS